MARRNMARGPVHRLDAARVTATLELLGERIGQRFPESGLARVCRDLVETSKATAERIRKLSRPYFGLQFLVWLTLSTVLCAQVYVLSRVDWSRIVIHQDIVELAQGLQATVSLLLLAASAIWFLVTAEQRLKRRRTRRALFELRSFAHVIDMHQLTKDPTIVLGGGQPTASSPERRMSQFELSRYLDYCTEMLALISKLAALYAGATQDEAIIAAVNELEVLTSDLGRKIWQKIMILSQLDERATEKT
jgi:hypothetical protein